MPRWRLSLSPSSLVHQHSAAHSFHQSAQREDRPNPRTWIYPPCPFINTAWITPANLGCHKRSGLQQNIPLRLTPFIVSLFFKKISRIIHFTLTSPVFSPQTVLVFLRPVACIFRLPKWFARLKLLRTNTMLYLGPKKIRSCGALLRPARLWTPPKRRMWGKMRFLSASSSAGIKRRCGASFMRV